MAEMLPVLTVVFVAASAALLIFQRYGHPAIPAYLAAGVALSTVVDESQVLNLAFLGIAFLVFVFGMRLDADRVYRLVQGHFSTTLLQVGVVGSGAFLIAWLWRFTLLESVLLGVAASLSSSLVATEILARNMGSEHIHGRLSEAINLVQDLLAIVVFIGIGLFTAGPGRAVPALGWIAAIFIAAGIIRQALPYITHVIGNSREIMLLTALTVLSTFILAADRAGISIVVGSFAAGAALSKFPYNIEMLETMTSLKDFFAAIFFVSLGAAVTFPSITGLLIAAALFFATVFLKPAVTVMSIEYHGYDSRTAYLTALHLDQTSEFALILTIQLFLAGSIGADVFHGIVLAAAVTMVTSSYTSRHGDRIYEFLDAEGLIDPIGDIIDHDVDPAIEDHCIIAGFHVQGKQLAAFLEERGVPFVVIDNDPDRIIEARGEGYQYVFADVNGDSAWNTAQADDADLVISTIPFPSVSERLLSLDIDADIILRSEDQERAADFAEECLYVINSDILATQRIISHIRNCLESDEYREQLREESMEELS